MGNMHGSSWWIGSCVVRLIDLIVARSAGEIGPLSFCSLRRTSFSRAALSVKSTLVGCGLQSAALFFTNAGGGGAGGGGGVGGGGGRGGGGGGGGAWAPGSRLPRAAKPRSSLARRTRRRAQEA